MGLWCRCGSEVLSKHIRGSGVFQQRPQGALLFRFRRTLELKEADWNEYLGRAYLYWTPHKWLAFRAEYGYEKFKYADQVNLGAKEVETHSVPLGVNFFHPSGLFARLQTTYYYQSGVFERFATGTFESAQDTFWLVDAVSRLPSSKALRYLDSGSDKSL